MGVLAWSERRAFGATIVWLNRALRRRGGGLRIQGLFG